ncbi:Hypothetical predicted protein [Lecanosticta acicola]|uniref:Uncharacterized protein n=1 Tax=Lecanosticta acicola TaxID=111012 RepID=A0AAI8Z5E9_9PEZI|nr:Hypothetical predicted protein [Lecanosticta acicola]
MDSYLQPNSIGWYPGDFEACPDSEYLACGQHKRVPRLPGIKKLKPPRPLRRLLPGETPGSCLCHYTEYPELLKERRADRAKSATDSQQPFRLLDLPAELRLQIYGEMLSMPGGVEFCPAPWIFEGTAPGGNIGRKAFDENWDPISEHHYEKHKQLSMAARVLRASKQIYREAKPVFYGENEWRFTSTSGWIGLDAFMYQIGLENCKLLRNITVCHPGFTVLPLTLAGERHFWSSIVGFHYLSYAGTFLSRRWFEEPLTGEPAAILQKFGMLRNLDFVIPRSLFGANAPFTGDVVDQSRFHNLNITQVSLSSQSAEDVEGPSWASIFVAAHNANIGKGERKWAICESEHDAMGDYEIDPRIPEGEEDVEEGK